MRILFISYYHPLGKGGFEKQALGLMKALAIQGHELACLTVASPEDCSKVKSDLEASGIFKLGCFVISHNEEQYSLVAKLLFWLVPNPVRLMVNQTPDLKNSIQSIITNAFEDLNIDVIHCLSLRTSYFLIDLLDKPIVLDLVDSFTNHKIRLIRYYLINFSFKGLLSSVVDLLKTVKIERATTSIYANKPITVVSRIDSKVLTQINSRSQIYVVPFGSDILPKAEYHNLSNQNTDKSITFYGFLDQVSNDDALFFLINDIVPIVLSKHPDLRLLITGLNIPSKILALSQKFSWIEIFPTIDDISSFAAKSTLNCWPFRFGSGFKTKILESMYLSKSIVTTTIGSEALSAEQKKGILIADDANGLAAHLIHLLDNPSERVRLGEINHQTALRDFTWEKKAQDFSRIYDIARKMTC